MELQGRAPKAQNGSVWETLPTLEHLLEHSEALKNRKGLSRSVKAALNNM
jgi:hypothetical protein